MSKDDEFDPALEALIEQLHEKRGFDFRGYKRSSLRRRITKRICEANIPDFAAYQEFLDRHPDEYVRLLDTILINVTSFFRDSDAWGVIEHSVLPEIVQRRGPGQVRVWSVGCATGEEAYSIAMLLAEALTAAGSPHCGRIYATDLDTGALALARHGRYSEEAVAAVPPRLREKYFHREDGVYVIAREIRKTVIFGRHNVVEHAPISQVNLLICRNLLIYLDLETQKHVLPRLHYALAANGVLFLGKAESPLARSALFQPLDVKNRIFVKSREGAPVYDLSITPAMLRRSDQRTGRERAVMEVFFSAQTAAHMIVDAAGSLVFANRTAREWFSIYDGDIGRPFGDLQVSFRPMELRSRIEECRQRKQRLRLDGCEWSPPHGEQRSLRVELSPLIDPPNTDLGTAISFTDVSEIVELGRRHQEVQENLETALEELQSSNEELETTNEELQSTNEELETTNEELQSTNEELETTNEELHSTNEEMETSNEELRARTDELDDYRRGMESLLGSLPTGLIVTDSDFCITLWNRESEHIWGIRKEDVIGKRLEHADIGLPADQLRLETDRIFFGNTPAAPIELQVDDRRGRTMRCRLLISPLFASDGKRSGVVFIVEDLTAREYDSKHTANGEDEPTNK